VSQVDGEGPDPALVRFVERSGLFAPDAVPRWAPLTGGVASDIWPVAAGGRTIAVKKALARLRVARDWRAPVSRNASEVAWLRQAHAIVPGAVPEVLAHDPAIGAFAMTYLEPADHPVWKRELAGGRADPDFAAAVGRTIARIHAATGGDAAVAAGFSNDAVFHAIRLEPYLEATAGRHPDLAGPLTALSRETLATKRALVHGDVSPKNILAGPEGPVLLDAECAWFGDPAFDLAFCLNHLLLKGARAGQSRAHYAPACRALTHAYLAGVDWEAPAALEGRAAALLPALLLARIDGKSPVEYLVSDVEQNAVRAFAEPRIVTAPTQLEPVIDDWTAGDTRA
jgi:aminoglycoside phosphotransferase (APT) family kinase protein